MSAGRTGGSREPDSTRQGLRLREPGVECSGHTEDQIPVDIYHKTVHAASILLLEERGKLNVSDPVKKYIPNAPQTWDKITIFDSLTHTSGIRDFTDFPDYPSRKRSPATPAQLVAWFRGKPLDFQPGDGWRCK
jgi:hypothetical protein